MLANIQIDVYQTHKTVLHISTDQFSLFQCDIKKSCSVTALFELGKEKKKKKIKKRTTKQNQVQNNSSPGQARIKPGVNSVSNTYLNHKLQFDLHQDFNAQVLLLQILLKARRVFKAGLHWRINQLSPDYKPILLTLCRHHLKTQVPGCLVPCLELQTAVHLSGICSLNSVTS